MGRKVHPTAFRLGYISNWKSRWFNKKKYRKYLEQDHNLREYIKKHLKQGGIKEVEIKRSANLVNIIIHAARPGIIIGRGGGGLEKLRKDIKNKVLKDIKDLEIRVDIEEIRKPETHAAIVAQGIADQLERRMPYRRVMKQALDKIIQNPSIKGAKICVAGRLGGAEMSRKECTPVKGQLPLQTLRADVDYAYVNAYTAYGVIGVKVWIYKGEVFDKS